MSEKEKYIQQIQAIIQRVSYNKSHKKWIFSGIKEKTYITLDKLDVSKLYDEVYSIYHYTDINIALLSGLKQEEKAIENIDFFKMKLEQDKFWDLEEEESTGTIVARKMSERARIPVKSYYKVGVVKLSSEVLEANSKITDSINAINVITARKVFIGSEKIDSKAQWTYVYGKDILRDEFGEDTIRFYFNLKPDTKQILAWQFALSKLLNQLRIPYNLKYLSTLDLYNRTDSGVLYISNSNFHIAAPVIYQIYSQFKGYLGNQVPLFTKEVLPGLGFAENPLEKGSSFGFDRAKRIVDGLIDYLITLTEPVAFDVDKCTKFIINQKFNSQSGGVDIEKPYLNVKSSHKYNFSLFNLNHSKIKRDSRNRYLNAAQYFAKVLRQKAIWYSETNYTWVTFIPPKNNKDVNAFRPINPIEKKGIQLFLDTLEAIENGKDIEPVDFSDVIDRNKDSNFVDNNWTKVHSLLFNLSKQEVKIDNTKEQSNPNLKVVQALFIDKKPRKLGDEIISKYVEKEFPYPNGYRNWEFCPTISHGLAMIGYFFLWLYAPNKVMVLDKKLLKEGLENAQIQTPVE